MTPRVLVADPIAADGVELLKQHADVDIRTGLKPDELITTIGDYDALVVRSETKVTAAVIEAGRKLQVIGRAGVGVDNIDVEAATGRGITVVYAPAGNTVSAAEHTIALMLSLARLIPQAHATLKGGAWKRGDFVGTEVRGKTLGLIGLGRVGSEVARRAQGLEMQVIAFDPYVSQEYARNLGVEMAAMDDILARSDFVSVHTPLTGSTRHLLGRDELAKMKPGARVINVARGGIIDEEALTEAVNAGRLAGAAVDVFSTEPTTDNVLIGSPRIVVTPHLGASTAEAQVSVAVDVAEEINAVLAGRMPRYSVNAPLISPETYPVIAPYIGGTRQIARLAAQLAEGQRNSLTLVVSGDIAKHDTTPLRAAAIGGMLEDVSEQPITMVNADLAARNHGLRVVEQKETGDGPYGNLLTVRVGTTKEETVVAGTVMRDELHIVLINGYWLDVVPSSNYFLVSHHLDRPGMIGTVGTILGQADVNISAMIVGRQKPRGEAMMVLGLDEPISEELRQRLLQVPDVFSVKQVKL